MKRSHYLLLGLLVSLTIAATGPGLPPTRIAPGAGITVVTNGVNSFTLTSSGGGVNTSNGLATNLTVYSSGAAAPLIVNTNQLIVTNGYVGIGTANPVSTFAIAGGMDFVFQSGATAKSQFAQGGADLYLDNRTAAGNIIFRTVGNVSGLVVKGTSAVANTLVLDQGRVGIGTNTPTESLHVLGNALITANLTANDLSLSKTITAPATTGNQTINKAAGRVNIAAAGTTVVVTCSLVTANSIIVAVAATADATARVTNVVPAAGSFTINTVATTAETAFNFLIVN